MSEKILIVDDDIDSLKLIGLMLQRHGYEVLAANTGGQALNKADVDIPDLIILDVMMPDMNGYEVCRRLRANPSTKSIPIIMFTAKTLIDDKVAGFEAGADDYLTKPTHPAELASRVKAVLQRTAGQRKPSVEQGVTIGVIGAKGGVGTTTTTLNIGAAFHTMGQNPVILELRPGAGSMGLYLKLDHPTLANILTLPAAEINEEIISTSLVKHSTGLRLILSSFSPKESLLRYTPDVGAATIRELRKISKPALVDLGSGLTMTNERLLPLMDKVVVLTTSDLPSLTMARALLQALAQEAIKNTYVVVNNRVQTNLQPSWSEVENLLGHEIHATIAAAPELAYQAVELGTPMVYHQPHAIVSSQFTKLAEEIHGSKSVN